MTKKQYLTIFITIIAFIIIIATIILTGNKKNDWINNIINSESYIITMKDCNDREITLPKETIQKIKNNWNNISDNGPWTGDTNKCYKTIIISYENNDVIEKKEIKIIDDNSLALISNNDTRYYVNTKEINDYLNNLFTTY